MKRVMTRTVLAAMLLAAGTDIAVAQTTPENDVDRAETRIERRQREPRTVFALDGAKPKPWAFSLSSPLKYASNVALADSGTQQAVYVDPGATLGRDFALGSATLSIEAGTDLQMFSSHAENDNATAYGNARLTFGGTTVKPYLDYTAVALFDGQFDAHAVTVHQFSAGATAKFPLAGGDTFSLDGSVTRREATVKSVESVRGSLTAKFKHPLGDHTLLVLSGRGRYTDFTSSVNSARHDTNMLLSALVTHDLSDTVSVDIGATFERNWSNVAGKDYSAFEAGPSITLTTNF